jgi:hypothetical protein
MSARSTGSFLLIVSIGNQIGAPAATPITLSGSLRRSPAGGDVNGYAMRLRGLIIRSSNLAIRCLNLDNAASILVPKTSRLTSRPSCAPDHKVKSLLV